MTLTFTARDSKDIGDHFITLQASLSAYPEVAPVVTDLFVSIAGCKLQSLIFNQVPGQ